MLGHLVSNYGANKHDPFIPDWLKRFFALLLKRR
jgi:hypothetical protein